MKLFLASLVLCFSFMTAGYCKETDTLKIHQVGVDLLESQINLLETEVKGYNKEQKQYHRTYERAKDRENRLKYKVVRQLSKMDTTVAHKMTYAEWQLVKTQKTLEQTNLKLATTDKMRQEKIVKLGRLSQQLNKTRMALAQTYVDEHTTHGSKDTEPKKKPVRSGRNHWR